METIPLKTANDIEKWAEKTINEIEENNTSIARGNARIATMKIPLALQRLKMDYAKLCRENNVTVTGVGEFLQLEKI